jgi:hypothetical protein
MNSLYLFPIRHFSDSSKLSDKEQKAEIYKKGFPAEIDTLERDNVIRKIGSDEMSNGCHQINIRIEEDYYDTDWFKYGYNDLLESDEPNTDYNNIDWFTEGYNDLVETVETPYDIYSEESLNLDTLFESTEYNIVGLSQAFSKSHLANDMSRLEKNKVSNKESLYGWLKIPNCSTFRITIKGKDLLWEGIGIDKNITPDISITPANNRNMNRYITYNIKRLERCRDKGEMYKFWRICWRLMRYSNCFRVSAINKVFENWDKSMPFKRLLKINARASQIIHTKNSNLEYNRVYIPKAGSDSYRPLGVPQEEWRLVLHMMNNFLNIWLDRHLLSSQHGFVPGRGTLTAWRGILDKVINKDFIYECDLKQFFPSVNVNYITTKLIEYGIPKEVCYYLENINRCQPRFPSYHKLDESKYIATSQDQEHIRNGYYRPESKMYYGMRAFLKSGGTIEQLRKETGMDNIFEIMQYQWAISGDSPLAGHF